MITLQSLITPGKDLTSLQRYALEVACGLRIGVVKNQAVWQQLIDLRLVNADHTPTYLGKEVLDRK